MIEIEYIISDLSGRACDCKTADQDGDLQLSPYVSQELLVDLA